MKLLIFDRAKGWVADDYIHLGIGSILGSILLSDAYNPEPAGQRPGLDLAH
jgi:hypothetical protein